MLIFLHGQDTYRSRQKLNEIIAEYKKVHKEGLDFACLTDFEMPKIKEKIEAVSMFSEKKLLVLEDCDDEELIDYIKKNKLAQDKEVILVFYQQSEPDRRTKMFKFLNKKPVMVQSFEPLAGAGLENWLKKEITSQKGQIDSMSLQKLIFFVGSDLWRLKNEIDKLLAYSKNITSQNIDLLVKAKIDNNIFDTIDALGQRDKPKALKLLHRHLNEGESEVYLMTMLTYQIRNLLKLKSLEEKGIGYYDMAKQAALHPFVVKKSASQIRNFSLSQLKNIYQRLLQIDVAIKSGKIDQQAALDILVAEI